MKDLNIVASILTFLGALLLAIAQDSLIKVLEKWTQAISKHLQDVESVAHELVDRAQEAEEQERAEEQ